MASAAGGLTVYIVDDGSVPAISPEDLPAATAEFWIVLSRHPINLGQGAALETARRIALQNQHDVFVTMDSDGQHDAADLPRLLDAIDSGADVALGNRFAGNSNVPASRRLILSLARCFEFAVTGLWLADAHNGFRAFNRKAMAAMEMRQARMAHATEIKQIIARLRDQLKIVEVPVSITYSAHSLAKGQSSLGAINILRDMTFRYLFGRDT